MTESFRLAVEIDDKYSAELKKLHEGLKNVGDRDHVNRTREMGENFKKARESAASFGETLKGVFPALGGFGLGSLSVGAGLTALVEGATKASERLEDLRRVAGSLAVNPQFLADQKALGERYGIANMNESLKGLQTNLDLARHQKGEMFNTMSGVAPAELERLRSAKSTEAAAAEAERFIAGVSKNPAQRRIWSSLITGSDTWSAFGDEGPEEFEKARKAAQAESEKPPGPALKAAKDFNESKNRLQNEANTGWDRVAAAVLPAMTWLSDHASGALFGAQDPEGAAHFDEAARKSQAEDLARFPRRPQHPAQSWYTEGWFSRPTEAMSESAREHNRAVASSPITMERELTRAVREGVREGIRDSRKDAADLPVPDGAENSFGAASNAPGGFFVPPGGVTSSPNANRIHNLWHRRGGYGPGGYTPPAGSQPSPFGPGGGHAGSKNSFFSKENADAVRQAAEEVGTTPENLAAVMDYESAGTFNPSKWGGAGGKYMGLIQFGPNERKQYGAFEGQSFPDQMKAVVRYLKGRGFRKGMGIEDLYSTINAGSPGHYNASDGYGTVATHTAKIVAEHMGRAKAFLSSGNLSASDADEPGGKNAQRPLMVWNDRAGKWANIGVSPPEGGWGPDLDFRKYEEDRPRQKTASVDRMIRSGGFLNSDQFERTAHGEVHVHMHGLPGPPKSMMVSSSGMFKKVKLNRGFAMQPAPGDE